VFIVAIFSQDTQEYADQSEEYGIYHSGQTILRFESRWGRQKMAYLLDMGDYSWILITPNDTIPSETRIHHGS
jgi:hypothetical protein